MGYFKTIGFYLFELIGTFLNLLLSLVGMYPSLDLGVTFLLYTEQKRIVQEKVTQHQGREEKETEANSLVLEAKHNE
tara:strand:- start:900 stop:1130 length:231 start_codon:yes stop_codon:yes gene_type:complete